MKPAAQVAPRRMPVATDLSPRAGRGVRRATRLAQQHQAQLDAMHVLPPGLSVELAAAAHAAFDAHLTCFAGRGPTQRMIRSGTPATEITGEAAKRSAGLIIVGAHEQHRLAGAFLGSTPENLVRLSRIPILVVRGSKPDPYRTVVLAVEPSPVSAHAAQFGSALTPSADHIVSHVTVVVGETLMRMCGVTEPQIAQLRQVSTGQARDDIGRLAATLVPAPTAVEVEGGHPSTRLLELCHRYGADLIVVGNTGTRSGVGYALLGRVAQQVLKQARCNVLIVSTAAE